MLKSVKRILFTATLAVTLPIALRVSAQAAVTYTVNPGDSLWKISSANSITVTQLKQYNALTSDTLYIGQTLNLSPSSVKHTVQNGDTLWLISQRYGTTTDKIISYNNLTSISIYPYQVLYIPQGAISLSTQSVASVSLNTQPVATTSWPSITYTVKAGDYLSSVASKFGVSQASIIRYNYMTANEWLNEGQKIAINDYAPRNFAVTPGESQSPARTGKLVDWFLDGKYLIKRDNVFLITDVQTGIEFKVKMLGGINHSDIEPLTANDTLLMKKLFPSWAWKPRAVVIFHNGINFAASLSGMPHSFDSISTNNVSGHFDLYLHNSIGHSLTTSYEYQKQHSDSVLVAAGMK